MMTHTLSAAEWLSRLVKIQSVTPAHAGAKAGAPGEARIAAHVGQWFAELGGEVLFEDVYPDRPNVYAIWRNPASDRWLGLDVHTDTVGVEQMAGDPFSGEARDGRLWGRGAVDDKASLAVALAVLQELRSEGRLPAANLVVGAVADEEMGLGGAYVMDGWLRRRGLVLDELLVAEPTQCAPCYGHKGSASMRFSVQGVSTHTSQPHLGKNAIVGAARIALAMQAEHDRLQTLAPSPVGHAKLSVVKIGGGRAPNIVPDEAVLTVNRRVTTDEDAGAVLDGLAHLARAACDLPVECTADRPLGAFLQAPDSRMVRQFQEWSGREPITVPYCSDAAAYGGTSVRNILVLGPGSIDQAHGAEEWVEISQLDKLAGIYRRWWQ